MQAGKVYFETPLPQLEHFFSTVRMFLQSCGPGRPILLSKIASAGPVQMEWSMLQKMGVITKGIKLKQVMLQRPSSFQLVTDHNNQPHIMLVSRPAVPVAVAQAAAAIQNAASSAPTPGWDVQAPPSADRDASGVPLVPGRVGGPPGAAALPQGCAPLTAACLGTIGVLRPEQITAIEAHLRKGNGAERLSKLVSLFGVKRSQFSGTHFAATACGGDHIITLSSEVGRRGIVMAGSDSAEAVRCLDLLLMQLVPSRHSVGDVMVFCLDHLQYAGALARRLCASLGEKGLGTEAALARLFAIGDVVSNASSQKAGASKYLGHFQDLLPEAFEQLGREWFRRIEGHVERGNAERKVRAILSAWQRQDAFPPDFARGLESLLFAPVLENANANPELEPDVLLRRKLVRWFQAADQARLPYACKLRGLAGRALPTAACRARLCHFERYWHMPGVELPEDPDLYGDAERLAAAAARPKEDDGDGSVDGEALADEDFAAMGKMSQAEWLQMEVDSGDRPAPVALRCPLLAAAEVGSAVAADPGVGADVAAERRAELDASRRALGLELGTIFAPEPVD